MKKNPIGQTLTGLLIAVGLSTAPLGVAANTSGHHPVFGKMPNEQTQPRITGVVIDTKREIP